MSGSQRFLARLAKIRKEHREESPEKHIQLIRAAFVSAVPPLPGSMADDIYESVSDRIIERAGGDEHFLEESRYLADVADLFAADYDEDADPLHPDDWRLIGEIVNDYALDLEMETVNYVMRLVVDHKGV